MHQTYNPMMVQQQLPQLNTIAQPTNLSLNPAQLITHPVPTALQTAAHMIPVNQGIANPTLLPIPNLPNQVHINNVNTAAAATKNILHNAAAPSAQIQQTSINPIQPINTTNFILPDASSTTVLSNPENHDNSMDKISARVQSVDLNESKNSISNNLLEDSIGNNNSAINNNQNNGNNDSFSGLTQSLASQTIKPNDPKTIDSATATVNNSNSTTPATAATAMNSTNAGLIDAITSPLPANNTEINNINNPNQLASVPTISQHHNNFLITQLAHQQAIQSLLMNSHFSQQQQNLSQQQQPPQQTQQQHNISTQGIGEQLQQAHLQKITNILLLL